MYKQAEQIVKEAFQRIKRKFGPEQAAVKIAKSIPKHLPSDSKPNQHEFDAFRMKAIVLLKKNGLPSSILPALFNTPIQIELEEKRGEQKIVIKLTQEIENCGQKLYLEGAFVRPSEKTKHSIPIPESFKLKKKDH